MLNGLKSFVIKNNEKWWFWVIAALLIRSFSFYGLLFDSDEWTYWVIASEWMKGEKLYVDLMDIKPPGIFATYWILIKISLGKMWLARVWSAVLLGLASFHLFRIICYFKKHISSIVALFFLLSFSYSMGMALNTELFYVSFLVIGLNIAIRNANPLVLLLAGLLLGWSFSIKYVILIDVLAIGALWILSSYGQGSSRFNSIILKIIPTAIGFILPMAMWHVLFYLNGDWLAFKKVIYELPGKYIAEHHLRKMIDTYVLFHYRFIWLVLPAILGFLTSWRQNRAVGVVGLFWYLAIWLMILLSGRLHDHYWLQLIPCMVFFAATILSTWLRKSWAVYAVYAVLIFVGTSCAIFYTAKNAANNSSIKSVQEHIPLQEGSAIWFANGSAVFYYTMGQNCPTPFVHGSLLFNQAHLDVFELKKEEEWDKMLNRVDCVVLTHGSAFDQEFEEKLSNQFSLEDRIEDSHTFWVKTDKSQLKD